jgi:hypothetical protein
MSDQEPQNRESPALGTEGRLLAIGDIPAEISAGLRIPSDGDCRIGSPDQSGSNRTQPRPIMAVAAALFEVGKACSAVASRCTKPAVRPD